MYDLVNIHTKEELHELKNSINLELKMIIQMTRKDLSRFHGGVIDDLDSSNKVSMIRYCRKRINDTDKQIKNCKSLLLQIDKRIKMGGM